MSPPTRRRPDAARPNAGVRAPDRTNTGTNTGTDVATRNTGQENTVTAFIERNRVDLQRVMPSHMAPDAFLGLAAAYVRRDRKLWEAASANPGALILALRECAALGHMPMPKLFALVPFRMRGKDGEPDWWQITGIETYHGVIDRMFRAGAVQSVKAAVVRRNDLFVWNERDQVVVRHEIDPMADPEARGELAGVYAYAVLLTGGESRHVWLNAHQVAVHRAASKTGGAFWDGPWKESMWLKTACHGLETWVPTSVEYRTAVARSEAAAASGFPDLPDVGATGAWAHPHARPPIEGEIVEGTLSPPPAEVAASQTQASGSAETGDQPAVSTVDTGGADPDNDPPVGPEWPTVPTIPGT